MANNDSRSYDSNTIRKTNKQYHQLEKNIFEKNYFSYVGIVNELNRGPSRFEDKWCSVQLIPIVNYKVFNRETGYRNIENTKNGYVDALIPEDMSLSVGDVVLVVFTDVNFKQAVIDILKGASGSFFETDITKHSPNFGIITNVVIRKG